jgi:hypothetical protein
VILERSALNTEAAEESLKDYLYKGIAAEIRLADQAYALAEQISQHAKQIDEANFGKLFGSLQVMLSDQQTLAVTKLVDPVGKYRTRSIPGVLDLLDKHAQHWRMRERHVLTEVLVQSGEDASSLEQTSNAELTHAVVNHFRATLPDTKRLRESRDKVIAHNEDIKRADLQLPTWGDAWKLTEFAKHFTTTICQGYLGVIYKFTTTEKHPANQLRRLLRKAGIA